MLKDLVMASRSYRSFDPHVPVSYEQLLDWIDCARYVPSSVNLQMLKYVPVTDRSDCARILQNTHWAGKLRNEHLPPEGHAPSAYLILCADRSIADNADAFQKDVGISAQTVLLAAAEAGFGGCMLGNFSADAVKKELRLPESLVPMLVLAFGKPDEQVVLTELPDGGDPSYYRENGIHYVPKRSLRELIVPCGKESV